MLHQEIWKDVDGYAGLYQVSNLGQVKSLGKYDRLGRYRAEKIKATVDNGSGYCVVNLKHNGKQKQMTVHRLVAQAFIPNPDDKPEINHIDGCKGNNCVDNLEWASRSENIKHAFNLGLNTQKGKRKVICVETGRLFNSIADAEKWVGIKGSRIANVCNLRRGCKTCGGFHWRFVK